MPPTLPAPVALTGPAWTGDATEHLVLATLVAGLVRSGVRSLFRHREPAPAIPPGHHQSIEPDYPVATALVLGTCLGAAIALIAVGRRPSPRY